MASLETKLNIPTISIPVTLPQIAAGLQRLSPKELETLELLLDKKAMAAIEKSREQAHRGNMRELKL